MSWKNSTLGEVLSVIKNGINCEQNKNPIGEKITRIETIAKKAFDFHRVGYANLSESDKQRSRLQVGDILFSHINSPIHVGKTAIYGGEEEIFHGINLLLMRTIEDVNPHFFNFYLNYLFLNGYWEENCKKSVNQASVNQKDISKVAFNYPSLKIQLEIVEKIKLLFVEIDKAIALTELNLKNSESLFQSYLTEVFEKQSEEWKSYQLGDFFKVASSKRVLKSQWQDSGIPFFRGREITTLSKEGSVKNELFISNEMYEDYALNYGVPKVNDIMITAIGTIGNTYVVKELDKFYFKDASVLWLNKEHEINSLFVDFWFKSNHFRSQLDVGLGATVDTLTIGKVNSLKIKVPSLSTQSEIVVNLNCVKFECDSLLKAYKLKIKELNLLKESILRHAFNGELIKDK